MITITSRLGLTAVINPKGAELTSLSDNKNTEFIWSANPEYWAKYAPVLFPIVGTLKDHQFIYNDRHYSLPRHGFARDMKFECIDLQENSATFLLDASAETLKNFPFLFELELRYTLTESILNINYTVRNLSQGIMPFSIGAHPAFALPGHFSDYSLYFADDRYLECFLLENDLLSHKKFKLKLKDNTLRLEYGLFENDALILKTLQSKSVSIMKKDKEIIKVHLHNFPNLGIWTKPGAPFICIEPWFGYSDTDTSSGNLLEKEGIILLSQENSFFCNFAIEIF
ncbi:MAG TPA: aldose 1-epimerase family protein [Flavobacterium sp.]|jgi:galactose mutarotase-like enzyme